MDIYPEPERRRGENPLALSAFPSEDRHRGLFAEYSSMLDTHDCEAQAGGWTWSHDNLATIRHWCLEYGFLSVTWAINLSLNSTRSHSPARLRFAPKWGSDCFLQFIHITKACRSYGVSLVSEIAGNKALRPYIRNSG